MDESQALEKLSDVLTRLSANPYDLSLHAEHIQLATASGMGDQILAARQMLTTYWPAGDEVWLPMIEARIQQGVESVEDALEVFALFQTAEEDYFSILILQKHLEFLFERHAQFTSSELNVDESVELFSLDWTRTSAESIVRNGASHLTKGHLLWNAYSNWELENLEKMQEEDEGRTEQVLRVEDILLDRLKQPHSTHEETFQLYSTFTTNYKPPNIYERLLVTASKSKTQAVKAYERREQNEHFLAQSDYSLEAYNYYITYEQRAKKIDLPLLAMLYERAISDTAKRRYEAAQSTEIALRLFWVGYCDILRTNSAEMDQQRAVFQRAVRSIPGSGAIWSRYIRFLESTTSDASTLMQSVSEINEKALSSGLLQKDIEEIVPLVSAQASLIKRLIMSEDDADGAVESLFQVLQDGITLVRAAAAQGDPRFRLEKYLADLYINLAASPDLAIAMWETTAKHYKSSYSAWLQYIETLTKQEKYDEARAVFKSVVGRNLDWPEAIFDSWIMFEHLHGTVDDINDCMDRVARAQTQVNNRRAKEAEKAAYQSAQVSSELDAASTLISEATGQASMQVDGAAAATSATQVDELASDTTKKRKADESDEKEETNKKSKTVNPAPPKRDRENSTVFVADLPSTVSEDDLTALFKDCGAVREVKFTITANSHVAMVEFVDRESVPAALTKDKKKIDDQHISVHLAWQSTLYVTNFPEKADDAYIRQLFGQFGVLFDVRWPSKKFKATRRFCYVQFMTTEAAQAALSLHGKELEPGLTMNVFISNPERKKERTDASANEREVYVAGLSKFATKGDLEKLFKTYGTVKDVRMITDEAGRSKGVAFVEFEDEASAQRALQANNHDLKNRRIAVTMSDSRVRARQKKEQTTSGLGRLDDIRSRSVRIKGLPADTQEGLLQQALEKVVPVKRMEVFQDLKEATAELGSTVDAGKLLLLTEPLQFGGATLQISEERPIGGSKYSNTSQPKAGLSMFVPRNAGRPKPGLGISKKPVRPSSSISNASQKSNTAGKGQDDFRKLLG